MSISLEELTAGTPISPQELVNRKAAFMRRCRVSLQADARVEDYGENGGLERLGQSHKGDPEAVELDHASRERGSRNPLER